MVVTGRDRWGLRRFMNSPGAIAVGTAVMNVCTFAFTIAAAGILDTHDYGATIALLNLLMVVAVVQMGLQATAARRIVADPHAVADIERSILRVTNRTSLALGLVLAALAPAVTWLLQLDDVWPALLLAALAVPTTVMGGQIGILQGERRWLDLAWMYALSGLPRIAGLALVWWQPNEISALLCSGLGYVFPMLFGWWVLRHPRVPADPQHVAGDSHDGWSMTRESLHGAQALLAFFALANVDIIIARHVMSEHESGLYALGLIVTKMMLFLPQFVVIVLFPSLATVRQRRQAMIRGTAAIMGLGVLATVAVALLAGLAADVVGGPKLPQVDDSLWLFAALGALLAATQLLVYAVLARQGRRSILLVWLALGAAVVLGALTSSVSGLLAVMIVVMGSLTAGLFVVGLTVDREPAPAQ